MNKGVILFHSLYTWDAFQQTLLSIHKPNSPIWCFGDWIHLLIILNI